MTVYTVSQHGIKLNIDLAEGTIISLPEGTFVVLNRVEVLGGGIIQILGRVT